MSQLKTTQSSIEYDPTTNRTTFLKNNFTSNYIHFACKNFKNNNNNLGLDNDPFVRNGIKGSVLTFSHNDTFVIH